MQDQHQQEQQPAQQQQPSLQQQGEEELDDEVTTLSANPDKSTRSLKEQQYAPRPQPHRCACFNTRCEFFLFLLIALLIFAAGSLIYDNRQQEGEISQILTILQQNQNQKHLTAANQATTTQHDSLPQQPLPPAPITPVEVGPRPIPRKVWYFNRQDLIEAKQWTQLAFQRIKALAQEEGFEVALINEASWQTFLPVSRQPKLETTIKRITEDKVEGLSAAKIDRIVRELTVLEVLREHGGVFIEEDVVVTEKLEWVLSSIPNQLVNAWQLVYSSGAPQVVGFFVPQQSSEPQKEGRTGAKEETEQYIVRFPGLSSVFLAATPSNSFIIDLLEEYYSAVLNHSAFLGQLKRIHMENAVGSDGEGLMAAACQLVLRKKQLQLQMDQIAIEHYRIAAININFGPAKLRSYLGDTQADKIFNHLSFIPRQELQYEFGLIRYCALLAPMEKLYALVDQAIQSKTVVAKSFLHEFLLGKQHTVLEVAEEKLSKKKWEALPAKLWVYLEGAPYSSPFFTQLWMRHLRKVTTEAKFELLIVNEQNLEQHLPKEVVAGINQALTANKLSIYDSTKKQLISLAVLHEHGGVWVEPFIFFTEGLGWLREIAEKKFIWNRFGELPKVVAAFHPHFGSPFHWNYKEGSREAWHLAYEHSLIAAEPRSQLIADWLSQLESNLQLDYASVIHKFEGCMIKDHKWIYEQSHELISQDSIKCALGTKQLQLQTKGTKQSAPEYYGVWGLNGFAGLLKMREYTNFVTGRTMENPFVWRYSFESMQNIVGNVSFFAKVYDPTANRIEQMFMDNLGNPLRQFHSQSFLMKLVGETEDHVIRQDGRLYLDRDWRALEESRSATLAEDRANQQLANIPKILWIFQSGEIDRKDNFTALILSKIDSYSGEGGFETRFVNDQNYKAYLNAGSPSAKKLNGFLLRLSERLGKGDGNLKDHYQRIRGEAILLTLLYENGGVYLTRRIAIHQDLSWIQKVETLEFVNRAGKSQPQVFGFFSPGYSSPPITLNGETHVESPSLENFFLASGKKAEYVRDFLDEYIRVLEESSRVKERLRQLKFSYSWLRGDDPYYECFFLASQFTLFQKGEQLLTQNTTLNALQHYGLYTLNTHYYPYRLHKYFTSFKSPPGNVIKSLAGMHLTELEAQVGPLKYFSILPKTQEIADFISQAAKGTEGSVILEGSFIHKFLMPTDAKGLTKIDMVYQTTPPKDKWEALPKVVYVYISEGLQRASFGEQLIVTALRKAVTLAGFELKVVDNNNLEQYIDKVIIKKVNKLIVGDKEQYRSLIFRLAILSKHGGIALLPQTLLTEDFSWVANIAGIDRRMLFNRQGDNPKVLLTVDNLRSPAINWTYDAQGQTKSGHSIGWSDTVMAAEKDNELLKEWFEQLTTYFQLNPQELSQVFDQCGIRQMEWSAADSSRLGSDALVCVLNRKKKQLESQQQTLNDVCGYYRLWGIGESFGVSKMEDGLNLDQSNSDLNPFLWRRERKEVEATIGQIRPLVRLSERQVQRVGEMGREKRLGDWGKEGSLLMSQVFHVIKSELSEVKGQLAISL